MLKIEGKYLNKLYLTYEKNKITIFNYKKIIEIDSTYITVPGLKIIGKNLIIKKMDESVMEIKGDINNIEVIDNV